MSHSMLLGEVCTEPHQGIVPGRSVHGAPPGLTGGEGVAGMQQRQQSWGWRAWLQSRDHHPCKTSGQKLQVWLVG